MHEDDLNLNLEELDQIEASADNKLKVKNRFQTLSEKVKFEAQEREKAESQYKVEAEARTKAEKERDFFKDFSSQSSRYPNASEYQDKIFEKVQGGYTTEDAIVAVLAKEGKLSGVTEQRVEQPNVAGGSAITTLNEGGNKDLKDMNSADKLAALMELEKQGQISL